jgi:TonB family protein
MATDTTSRNTQPYERYRARLAVAVFFSLLMHALLLSLEFGLPGLGLPGLELPWHARRAQATRLHVTIAGGERAPAPGHPATPVPGLADEVPRAAPLAESDGLKLVPPRPEEKARPPATQPTRKPKNRPATVARKPAYRAKQVEPVIALPESRPDTFIVPASPLDEALPEDSSVEAGNTAPESQPAETPVAEVEAARRAAEEEARRQAAVEHEQRIARENEAAAQRERELEAQRQEEAVRRARESEMLAQAALLEQQRLDAQRRELEESARRALEREVRQREEMQRLEAARLEREAAEQRARKEAEEAARRQEELAARRRAEAEMAATRQQETEIIPGESTAKDGARAAPATLPRDLMGGGLAGRALDQARRSDIFRNNAPASPSSLPDSSPSPRRHSVFGSVAQDVGLMLYVESWRLKIERNGNLNYRRSSADNARGDPIVTVAIRSDGSVEDVIIQRSSGRPELDEAVRRIVRINARYSAFPPELARRFDVIEIRRIWNFDDRLRILEEVR